MREEKEFLHFIQNIHIVKGSEGSEGSKGVVAAGAAVYSLLPQEGGYNAASRTAHMLHKMHESTKAGP
jgi:hypothetical protein